MRLGWLTFALIAVGISCVVGCRQDDSLTGKVTYNGQPVEMGSVMFASSDGSGPGFGAQIVDGQYEADKVRRGEHVAHVRGLSKTSTLTKEEFVKLSEQHGNRAGLPVDYIPESAEGNGRTVDIEGGKQTLDFDLKGPPRSG